MIGGSIESISIDSRSFPVPADTDITTMIGGFKNETLPNGNGTARTKKERVPWKLSGVVLGNAKAIASRISSRYPACALIWVALCIGNRRTIASSVRATMEHLMLPVKRPKVHQRRRIKS